MEKRTQLRNKAAATVTKQHDLGSWRLPSGNEVNGVLLNCPQFYGMHMEIATDYPFTLADLHAYADFIVPEARHRATALVSEPQFGKTTQAKRKRT